MNLRFLETFVWVARLNSFSLVAEKLHISQATVSARMAALEQELGVKLFQRGGRCTGLTEHGERACLAADRLLRVAAEFSQQVNGTESFRGTIRIGVSDTIAFTLLPAIMARLRAVYPKVNFELHAGQSNDLSRQVVESKLHLVLILGVVTGNDIVSRPLINLAATWVASPQVYKTDAPVNLDDLGDLPIISYPKGSIPHETLRGYFSPKVFQTTKIYWCNSLATIVRLARDGLGIAVVPEAVVCEELAKGTLHKLVLLPAFPHFVFNIAYVDSPETALPGQIAELISIIAQIYCHDVGECLAWTD